MGESIVNKIVIGIDQSYTRAGVAIAINGKLVNYYSIDYDGCINNIQKRFTLRNFVRERILFLQDNVVYDDLIIIMERDNSKHRLVIKNSAELTACIVDMAYKYGVDVYSVVATAVKSKVIPKKYGKPDDYKDERKPNKMPAIMFCEKEFGIDLSEKDNNFNKKVDKKGRVWYNDDVADSITIAMYGFIDEKLQKLQKEE